MPYTYNGITKSLTGWAEQLGYSDGGSLLYYRINKWGLERALETAPPEDRNVTFNGKTQTIPMWAKEIGMKPETLRRYIQKRGVEAAFNGPHRRTSEKHGKSKTQEYRIWNAMITRCYNKNHPQFADYGGRGIFVCDEWRHSFLTFIADVGPRPKQPNMTIDRLDNDGPYAPGNVAWRTRKENQNNRRCSTKITHNGVSKTVSQWADEFGVDWSSVYRRWQTYGTLEGYDPKLKEGSGS